MGKKLKWDEEVWIRAGHFFDSDFEPFVNSTFFNQIKKHNGVAKTNYARKRIKQIQTATKNRFERLKELNPNCFVCFEAIDYSLPRGSIEPMSPSIEHIIPKSKGGSNVFSNLAVSHKICNLRRGNNL